jgi:hypothetical protein
MIDDCFPPFPTHYPPPPPPPPPPPLPPLALMTSGRNCRGRRGRCLDPFGVGRVGVPSDYEQRPRSSSHSSLSPLTSPADPSLPPPYTAHPRAS